MAPDARFTRVIDSGGAYNIGGGAALTRTGWLLRPCGEAGGEVSLRSIELCDFVLRLRVAQGLLVDIVREQARRWSLELVVRRDDRVRQVRSSSYRDRVLAERGRERAEDATDSAAEAWRSCTSIGDAVVQLPRLAARGVGWRDGTWRKT